MLPQVGEAVSCDKADETIEDEECQAESKPYQVVFPNTFLDLLVMAFNILESGVQRVSEAREKMAELFSDEPRERSEVCLPEICGGVLLINDDVMVMRVDSGY